MAKLKFTQENVELLRPESKSKEYYDTSRTDGDRALGMRVSPKGKKVFFMLYYAESTVSNKGNSKKFTLGVFPEMNLASARDKIAEHRKGDPVLKQQLVKKEKREKAEAEALEEASNPTMNLLWDVYIEDQKNKKKQKTLKTKSDEERRWNKTIKPKIGDKKVKDITPAIISDILDSVAKTAPVSANRLHSFMRVLFKPALKKGWINAHPMQWIDLPGGSEPPRKRILSDDEIKHLWPYFNKARPNPRDILKILLLTCQRSGEVMRMKWEDIDFESAIWRQEDNKTDVVNLVPLSPQVISILSKRNQTGVWVFPTHYNTTRSGAQNTGHTQSIKDARYKLREMSGLHDWTAHDLRRTGRTIMSRLKIKQHIRERVLNHAQGGIVGVYDQYDYLQEKADALDKLGREIWKILGKKETSAKIVKMQGVG
ncbi:MAG: tyrosine-type recombinase/integrase [Thiomicrorhabdus sp.]|jgi:integrase|nr:tyrosine-type recombinase/integrase [Thiomicrorhabdus sp.]